MQSRTTAADVQRALLMQRPLSCQVLFRVDDPGRIDMWQFMLCLLRQVFGIPDPVTGLTRAGGFVVEQVLVQRFDEADSFT